MFITLLFDFQDFYKHNYLSKCYEICVRTKILIVSVRLIIEKLSRNLLFNTICLASYYDVIFVFSVSFFFIKDIRNSVNRK